MTYDKPIGPYPWNILAFSEYLGDIPGISRYISCINNGYTLDKPPYINDITCIAHGISLVKFPSKLFDFLDISSKSSFFQYRPGIPQAYARGLNSTERDEVIHKDYLVLLNPDPLHKPVVCMGYRKIEEDTTWIDQNAKTWSRCSDIPD